MYDAEQLFGPLGPAPRFAVAFRGYDRSQVHSWLRAHELEMSDVAGPLAETTRRQQALESRLAELQLEASDASDASEGPSPESLAAAVLHQAQDIARELPDHMVHQAEAERQRAEESITQVIAAAHARSAQIIGAAQSDREEVGAMVDEARKQIDAFREQASGTARERVQGNWREASVVLTEVELELAGLRARSQIVLAKLAQLEESIEESRAQLREAARQPSTLTQPRPDRSTVPGAVMPIEW